MVAAAAAIDVACAYARADDCAPSLPLLLLFLISRICSHIDQAHKGLCGLVASCDPQTNVVAPVSPSVWQIIGPSSRVLAA